MNYIIAGIILLLIGYQLVQWLQFTRLFKRGRNPYHRICTRCGAEQEQWYSYNAAGSRYCWWQESRTGTDPKCICQKQQEYIGY